MKIKVLILLCFFIASLQSCRNANSAVITVKKTSSPVSNADSISNSAVPDAAVIIYRKEVPVLCYHHIRAFRSGEPESMKGFVVTVQAFKDQVKMLADSGYHTITPDQYYAYLTAGAPLPSKPIMITFDDTDEEQYTVGATELNKYGFKGVYFIMTISIGRPRYITRAQLRALADSGHVIEAHTWDHHKVTEYTDSDWDKQLTEAQTKLQDITGKPVVYFAYPYGIRNEEAEKQLRQRGIRAAFQLSTKRDSLQPLYSIRRMIVHGSWDIPKLQTWMKIYFH